MANNSNRRNANKHHAFFACVRCYLSFESETEYSRHCTMGDECEPHCISSECEQPPTPSFPSFAGMPSKRRHRRRMHCPPYKMVSIKDRWQFLYHLKYPERLLPEPR
jgi:hypothetical protein